MKFHSLFISLVFFFGCVSVVYSEETRPDPQTLIDEMSKASRELNYDGVFVYRLGKQIDTMRIIHKSDADDSIERLISLTGHAREVIRDKDQVRCYFPENKAVVVEKSRLGKLISTYLPQPIKSISEFYIFEIAGEDRVAGLDAWIINIRPIDKFRYGYQLWIDKKSRLLLKSELKNQLGVTLEQIMFAQLNVLDEIEDSLLEPSVSDKDYTWHHNENKINIDATSNDIQWKATWMPAGFTMSEQSREPMITSHTPVDHLIYSDGLAMVSIYVEKLNQQPDANTGHSNFGGVNTYATHTGGYQITAVGEVPKATVKLMAASVKSYQ